MPLDLLEREHTDAGRRTRVRSAPWPAIPPAFYGGSFNLGSVIASTSPTYDVLIVYAGTSADPPCRLLVTDQNPPRTTAYDVLEIRFLSGLTWEELGQLFGVSRRSVHNWANGEALKVENIILVGETLRAIKELRRSSSVETRLALLSPLPSGKRPLDLLRAKRWQDAIAAVKALPVISVPPSAPDPMQPHPTAYFGALTDRPAATTGQIIRGRSRRIPRHTP
jgi:hypothetical protein